MQVTMILTVYSKIGSDFLRTEKGEGRDGQKIKQQAEQEKQTEIEN